jgi:hypothetical protein
LFLITNCLPALEDAVIKVTVEAEEEFKTTISSSVVI